MTLVKLARRGAGNRHRGFSMIEVLVTLAIISLALLGTAGLQAYSMRLNQGGQFRTQAVFLAADLAERMEANKAGAVAGLYAAAAANRDCLGVACSAAFLAEFDLFQWQTAVVATLPQSTTAVTRTTLGNLNTYTITISWVDRRGETTNANFDVAPGLGVNATGTGERFFYTATRTIFN